MIGVFYPSELTEENRITGDHCPVGWYITSKEDDDTYDEESYWVPDDTTRNLTFANKRDCQIACESFNRAGITSDEMLELSDDEMCRIACENLPW